MARFSISVPIGAWHPMLSDCLESLVRQDAELEIAVLDASGDPRTGELIERYRDRIFYLRIGPDAGQSDAILEGWANTSGDVLGWLNADDALAPGAFANMAARFDGEPDTDIIYGHTIINNELDDIRGFHWAVEPPTEKLLRECIVSQPSCFFRRAANGLIGGLDASLHYTMDWDLWVRLWKSGAKFGFTDDVLSRVLWGSDTKTGGFNKARRAELRRLIGGNDRLRDRINSQIGFVVHHLTEQPLFARFAPALHRRMAPDARPIHGIGRTGEICGTARLPLFHYRTTPVTQLEIDLFAPANLTARLLLDDTLVQTVEGIGNYLEVSIDAGIPAGRTAILELESLDSDARLKSISLK